MDVKLVLVKKDGTVKPFTLPSEVTVIGRRYGCDLQIPLRSVSRRHCQLNLDEGVLKLRDLNSRNGTLLNGRTVDSGCTVEAGDCIKIGPCWFVCQIDGTPKDVKKAYEKFAEINKASKEDTAMNMEPADAMAETQEPAESKPPANADEFEEMFDETA